MAPTEIARQQQRQLAANCRARIKVGLKWPYESENESAAYGAAISGVEEMRKCRARAASAEMPDLVLALMISWLTASTLASHRHLIRKPQAAENSIASVMWRRRRYALCAGDICANNVIIAPHR